MSSETVYVIYISEMEDNTASYIHSVWSVTEWANTEAHRLRSEVYGSAVTVHTFVLDAGRE